MSKKLKTFFPEAFVELPTGRTVGMRPIPLRKISEYLDSILALAALQNQGLSPIEMIGVAAESVWNVLDACLVDASVDEMTAADGPFLLEVFLEQNLSGTVVGKWKALGAKFKGLFPGIMVQSNSEIPSQKESNS